MEHLPGWLTQQIAEIREKQRAMEAFAEGHRAAGDERRATICELEARSWRLEAERLEHHPETARRVK